MGEHTPGPWECRGFRIFAGGSRKRVAEAWLALKSSAETNANAALIAAAPDLLKTLEFYADATRWKPNSYGIVSAHDDAGDRARAALSAASGRAPTNKEE